MYTGVNEYVFIVRLLCVVIYKQYRQPWITVLATYSNQNNKYVIYDIFSRKKFNVNNITQLASELKRKWRTKICVVFDIGAERYYPLIYPDSLGLSDVSLFPPLGDDDIRGQTLFFAIRGKPYVMLSSVFISRRLLVD